jgi:hypothetical protein
MLEVRTRNGVTASSSCDEKYMVIDTFPPPLFLVRSAVCRLVPSPSRRD